MNLVLTSKVFIPHNISLGVPPKIEGKRCLNINTKEDMDIFEYCEESEPQDLFLVNGLYFKQERE